MFTNLIESASHIREYKRRSSFFLITVASYAVILFAAGIVSVYAYDAQLEAQNNSLELLSWVPPVTTVPKPINENHSAVVRRSTPATAPVDRNITVAERTVAISNDPRLVPNFIDVNPNPIPPVTGPVRIGDVNKDPPFVPSTKNGSCLTCTGQAVTIETDSKPPEPPPIVKPPTTERVTSKILIAKIISMPQPAYPRMAKDTHTQGPVNIQILVDEQGKVISAQVVSGNPMLSFAAKDAAMRARFTPTVLNGQPVKIQGVITYNFVLQ